MRSLITLASSLPQAEFPAEHHRLDRFRKIFSILLFIGCPILFAEAAPTFEAEAASTFRLPAQLPTSRKTVIDVRTSPVVYLPGPAFAVEVYSTNPISP